MKCRHHQMSFPSNFISLSNYSCMIYVMNICSTWKCNMQFEHFRVFQFISFCRVFVLTSAPSFKECERIFRMSTSGGMCMVWTNYWNIVTCFLDVSLDAVFNLLYACMLLIHTNLSHGNLIRAFFDEIRFLLHR